MLIQYELLKLLRKKFTLILMAVSLALTAFLFGLPVMQYQIYDENGVIKGMEGIRYEKEQAVKLPTFLTEEYIAKTVHQVQGLFQNPHNVGYDGNEQFLIGEAYWKYIAPRENLLNTIAKAYDNPGEHSGYNKLADIDAAEGAKFYQAAESKREALLEDPARRMTAQQKAYWSSMAAKVSTPLKYGYYQGWETLISSFELLMFAILSICIVIAPVFAGEYQAGTDALILPAKYGKTKLVTAKIRSAFLFGALAFTLHIIIAFGILLTTFGTDGWELPLQAANMTIPYDFTFLQAALAGLGVLYLILFAAISLTLLLSSKMKTPYLVLPVLAAVLFVPMFLTPDGTTGIYNQLLFLLPYRAAMPELGKYISYQFGSLVLDAFAARTFLYVILTVIMLPFARRSFKKHQAA